MATLPAQLAPTLRQYSQGTGSLRCIAPTRAVRLPWEKNDGEAAVENHPVGGRHDGRRVRDHVDGYRYRGNHIIADLGLQYERDILQNWQFSALAVDADVRRSATVLVSQRGGTFLLQNRIDIGQETGKQLQQIV